VDIGFLLSVFLVVYLVTLCSMREVHASAKWPVLSVCLMLLENAFPAAGAEVLGISGGWTPSGGLELSALPADSSETQH